MILVYDTCVIRRLDTFVHGIVCDTYAFRQLDIFVNDIGQWHLCFQTCYSLKMCMFIDIVTMLILWLRFTVIYIIISLYLTV